MVNVENAWVCYAWILLCNVEHWKKTVNFSQAHKHIKGFEVHF